LPAAVLGDVATQIIVGAVVRLADYGGWGIVGESTAVYLLGLFFYYLPRKSAFVIAGTKMAPGHQIATAVALTVLGICLSLTVHIIGQQIAGNRVGLVNYMHACAESAGYLGGAAYLCLRDGRKRRTAATA
jgi:hypothetical protein